MTPTWFTEERIDALEAEAATWVGTPFAANSSAKGLGVSCHTLAGALYAAVGWGDILIPDVAISHARFGETRWPIRFLIPWPNALPSCLTTPKSCPGTF